MHKRPRICSSASHPASSASKSTAAFPPPDTIMARLLTDESSQNELTHIKCFDGTSKAVLSLASPLRSLDGEIVGMVVVIQDVTEHKQIEQDIEQRIQNLFLPESNADRRLGISG